MDIEKFDASRLLEINHLLNGAEMTIGERLFLNGVIRMVRPKKVVELGVSAGGSSCIILNAIRDFEGATLDSIDYLENYYRDPQKKVGWMVPERFPELTASGKWRLFTGGMACRHLDQITNGGKEQIDVCLIDTMHVNPGEILNLLEVLPHMSKGGVIIFHDTGLHISTEGLEENYTNCVLLAALGGKRFEAASISRGDMIIPNIGGIALGEVTDDLRWRLFSLLTLPWAYMISDADYADLLNYFKKYYTGELVEIFSKSYEFYKHRFVGAKVWPPILIKRLGIGKWTLVERWKDAKCHNVRVLGIKLSIRRLGLREKIKKYFRD